MRTRSHPPEPTDALDENNGQSSGDELDFPGLRPDNAGHRVVARSQMTTVPSGASSSTPAAPPTAAPLDTRAGTPGDGGGLADSAEVSLALRSVLAAERANGIGVQQLRMQHEAGQRAIKTEKDASDKHDTHDMKILRMLVNDFSASYTPPVAESESPTADTSMLTSQWLPTVRRRVADAVTRAEIYDILYVPTSRILKFSAKVRFGRNGLHPDLFKTYTFENAGMMAPLDADADALDKPLTAADLSDTLTVLDERCEQMLNWVEKVMSRNMALKLFEFFAWGSHAAKHDRKGLWALTDWKGLILDVLDDATRHIDVQLDTCKSLCEGALDQDAFFPSLAKVRFVAMARKTDGSRSIKPAWTPLVLEDAVVGGIVTLVSKVAALRAKQLEATEYERNRLGAVARSAVKKRALERSLLAKSAGSGASSKVRASGHEEVDDMADSDSAGAGSDDDAGGDGGVAGKTRSDRRKRAAATRRRAAETIGASVTKAQRRKRDDALTAAGAWIEHDLVAVCDKEVWETTGLLLGPVVRASGNTGLIGTRMMELGEREKLRDPACQICAEGKGVCLKNCTHDGYHTGASGEGCRYPHLDPKLFANGLPPQLKDANCVGRLPTRSSRCLAWHTAVSVASPRSQSKIEPGRSTGSGRQARAAHSSPSAGSRQRSSPLRSSRRSRSSGRWRPRVIWGSRRFASSSQAQREPWRTCRCHLRSVHTPRTRSAARRSLTTARRWYGAERGEQRSSNEPNRRTRVTTTTQSPCRQRALWTGS